MQCIHARYPRAAALPDDAGLLALLLGIDPGYHLSDTTRPTGAPPVLRNHHRGPITRARGREVTTTVAEPLPGATDPEKLQLRLEALAQRGGYCALTVDRPHHAAALARLRRLPVTPVDLEQVLLDALAAGVQPGSGIPNAPKHLDAVFAADAGGPDGRRWNHLCAFVAAAAVPAAEAAIAEATSGGDRPALVLHAHWLARYGQASVVARWRERVLSREWHGLWLLLPQRGVAPSLGPGAEVLVVTPAEHEMLAEEWV